MTTDEEIEVLEKEKLQLRQLGQKQSWVGPTAEGKVKMEEGRVAKGH